MKWPQKVRFHECFASPQKTYPQLVHKLSTGYPQLLKRSNSRSIQQNAFIKTKLSTKNEPPITINSQ